MRAIVGAFPLLEAAFLPLDLVADLLQCAPDQARDVHLRNPDLLCDLGLCQAAEEPEVEDRLLAVVEGTQAGLDCGPALRDLVPGLLRPDRLERLEDLLLLDVGRLGQLGDGRRATQLNRQLLDQTGELDVQLLQAARHADGPALVAEVPLDLADDVRRRVRRQLDAAVDVEAVDRLDQPDRPDLDEVLELLAAVRVAACERAYERHVLLDQLLARLEVAVLVVAAEQDLVVDPRHAAVPAGAIRLVSSTQAPPSRSSTSWVSQTVSSTRCRSRSPSEATSCTLSGGKGPSEACSTPSSAERETTSSPASSRRPSSASIPT